jgi:precorrin-3B C17-methyltransferase
MRTCSNDDRQQIKTDSSQNYLLQGNHSNSRGKLAIVGIGPGDANHLTPKAREAILVSTVIVGYSTYLDLIPELINTKILVKTGMTQEIDRCRQAIQYALAGERVSVISGGDAGIYGMAGLILELLHQTGKAQQVDVEIIPGISALNAAAALVGAPLMQDFAAISLSDLLIPWDIIQKRIELAAQADFVIVFYNPKSKRRKVQIIVAQEIIAKYRPGNTPVAVVTNATRANQKVSISNLSDFTDLPIDMFTTVIIGNSSSKSYGNHIITSRGYPV